MVKKALKATPDFKAAARAWQDLKAAVGPLAMDFDKSNAKRMKTLVDAMLASGEVGMDDGLVVFLMDWVAEFERQFVHLDEASPADVLRHLMTANGLTQADLAGELGGQPVVSAILRGKRDINAGQAARLGERFGVSPAAFIRAAAAADGGGETGVARVRSTQGRVATVARSGSCPKTPSRSRPL